MILANFFGCHPRDVVTIVVVTVFAIVVVAFIIVVVVAPQNLTSIPAVA